MKKVTGYACAAGHHVQGIILKTEFGKFVHAKDI